MNRVILWLDRSLSVLCIVICSALVVCVVWQVFSRYILNDPSTVTDELARFLFIWVGLIGAAYAVGRKKHLAIDLLLMKLESHPKKKILLQVVINLISLFFIIVIMCYGGGRLVIDTVNAGQISPVLGIQMGWVYFAIPLSGFFMVIFLVRDLVSVFYQVSLNG